MHKNVVDAKIWIISFNFSYILYTLKRLWIYYGLWLKMTGRVFAVVLWGSFPFITLSKKVYKGLWIRSLGLSVYMYVCPDRHLSVLALVLVNILRMSWNLYIIFKSALECFSFIEDGAYGISGSYIIHVVIIQVVRM